MNKLVIYTDLDGSLLDHHDYSHSAADELLAVLERKKIPVVPVSSKTREEILSLRTELRNNHPFIFENGAGVQIPANYFPVPPEDSDLLDGYRLKTFSRPRSHWLRLLEKTRPEFEGEFVGFAQLSPDEIAALTGLDRKSAYLASLREFGEPVQWLGDNPRRQQQFIETLEQSGARVLKGGRFLHVSDNYDKGLALSWLNQQYAKNTGNKQVVSIAVGDSENDKAMLEAADFPLIIRSPAHPVPKLAPGIRPEITRAFGPEGWAEGIQTILNQLKQTLENS